MREMLGVFFLLFHCLFVISRALLWDVAVIRILCICQCVCPSRLSILDEKNGMCVCLLCYLTCGWQWIWHTDEVIVKNFWEFVLDSSLASSSILKFIAKIQREWSRKRNEAHQKKNREEDRVKHVTKCTQNSMWKWNVLGESEYRWNWIEISKNRHESCNIQEQVRPFSFICNNNGSSVSWENHKQAMLSTPVKYIYKHTCTKEYREEKIVK